MKKLLVMCGTGIATSTLVTGRVKKWLEENGYDKEIKLYQGKIADEISRLDEYDIVISTTIVGEEHRDKVINGVPLITGRDTEQVFEKIETELREL